MFQELEEWWWPLSNSVTKHVPGKLSMIKFVYSLSVNLSFSRYCSEALFSVQ
jgi:hypothetical protein